MEVSPYLYAIFVGVILVAIGAAWLAVRLRSHDGPLRVEPGTKAQDEGPVSRSVTPVVSVSAPAPDILTETKVEVLPEIAKVADRPIEQGYKGFKIHLCEKQPGLWVAAIADSTPRNRKRQPDDRKASVTREYYQLPAAVAEAKIMIDRRLATRR